MWCVALKSWDAYKSLKTTIIGGITAVKQESALKAGVKVLFHHFTFRNVDSREKINSSFYRLCYIMALYRCLAFNRKFSKLNLDISYCHLHIEDSDS